MTSIREWLKEKNCDFASLKLIVQVWDDLDPDYPENLCTGDISDFQKCIATYTTDYLDPILDFRFYSGRGGPKAPRFIAEDNHALYFPSQYDGATSCVKVMKDIKYYLRGDDATPYP